MSMTVADIRELLETIAAGVETGHDLFPAEFVGIVRKFIAEISPDTSNVVAAVMGRTSDQFVKDLAAVGSVLDGLTKLFTTDQWSKIASFMRNMQRRYVILEMIALHLRVTTD